MFTKNETWKEANEWETAWHKKQQFNSYNEETKQYIYGSKMGLDTYRVNYYGIVGWDFGDRTVIDMGGSGQSILLKCAAKKRVVIDPIIPSEWMLARYKEAGIDFIQMKGEDFTSSFVYDIGLCYNVLQHVENPEKIAKNMRSYTKLIHIYEWIEHGISDGHIQNLTEQSMNDWFGGIGKTEYVDQNPCVGKALYGIFKGDHYEKA